MISPLHDLRQIIIATFSIVDLLNCTKGGIRYAECALRHTPHTARAPAALSGLACTIWKYMHTAPTDVELVHFVCELVRCTCGGCCRYEAVTTVERPSLADSDGKTKCCTCCTCCAKKKKKTTTYLQPPSWRTLLLPCEAVVLKESMRALHALLDGVTEQMASTTASITTASSHAEITPAAITPDEITVPPSFTPLLHAPPSHLASRPSAALPPSFKPSFTPPSAALPPDHPPHRPVCAGGGGCPTVLCAGVPVIQAGRVNPTRSQSKSGARLWSTTRVAASIAARFNRVLSGSESGQTGRRMRAGGTADSIQRARSKTGA